jgi:uncharacterized protein
LLLCPDTGPLLVLARIGQLDLLGSRILLVETVVNECTVRSDSASSAIRKLVESHGTVAVLTSDVIPSRLGPGEAAVLSWARPRKAEVVCVLDDRAARNAARTLGIRMTGTLGILLRAKAEGKLGTLRPVLEQAVQAGLYLDKTTISRALEAVGELK